MDKPSITARLNAVKDAYGITEDTELGKLFGASKSMVNQWYSGNVKSITARYAFKCQDNTGFSARWLQLGEGDMKLTGVKGESDDEAKLLRAFRSAAPPLRKNLLLQADGILEELHEKRA